MSHALGVPAFGGDQESRSAVLFEADAGAAGTPSASGGVAGDAAAVVPCTGASVGVPPLPGRKDFRLALPDEACAYSRHAGHPRRRLGWALTRISHHDSAAPAPLPASPGRVLDRSARAHVRGTAGTGKTLLALSEANRLGKEGEQVLFVVHSPYLARFLASG